MTAATQASVFNDPLALEIIWSRLVTVADEMQTTLRRTAFSSIVAAANDLGCDLLDTRGWLVAHAVTSNPSFNLTLPLLVKALRADFPPESWQPGDVLLTNDPWLVVGHLPDFSVVTPFFKNGRLAGFSGSIAHIADIGGILDIHQSRSIYEEGLQIPPLKLFSRGERNETLVRMIEKNVRAPEMVMGDLIACVTANAVAAQQAVALLDDYGLDDLDALSDAVQARAEAAMRRAIAEIPDGVYADEVTFNELDGPLTIGVELRVRGSELEVEYVDVPPEHPVGGINSTMNYTLARTAYTLNCLLTPNVASNEGLFRPITVRAPEGSLLNPRYPACVADRTKVGWHTTSAVQGALAKALPGHVPAPGGFKSLWHVIGHDEAGHGFRSFMFNGGGMGAGPGADGVDAICYPTSACNVPIELTEKTTTIHITEKEFLPDSGGAGAFRGGMGLRVTFGLPDDATPPTLIDTHLHHQQYPPAGLDGGRSGTPTRARLNGQPLTVDETRQRLATRTLNDATTRITIETAGGGGFGPPTKRDSFSVLRDVRNGLVSVEAAASDYGLLVDLDRLTVEALPVREEGRA